MSDLVKFFLGMNSLEVVNLSQNLGKKSKLGLQTLIKGLNRCKTLKSINLAGNYGINDSNTILELQKLIIESGKLEYLNISNL